jgi:plastocyanin
MQMRHAPLLSLVLLSVVIVVACSTAAPGWTYAPAPSATPAQSGAANAGASGAASGAPSGGASGAPSGGASGAPSGGGSGSTAVVQISATGIKFDQSEVTVAASAPFQIQFANNDAGTPHNVSIHQGGPTGPELFKGEIFNGVGTRTYDVPKLDPGQYSFVCSVHPTMTGTLTAQ